LSALVLGWETEMRSIGLCSVKLIHGRKTQFLLTTPAFGVPLEDDPIGIS